MGFHKCVPAGLDESGPLLQEEVRPGSSPLPLAESPPGTPLPWTTVRAGLGWGRGFES